MKLEDIKFSYVNLLHRVDRRVHMEQQLAAAGIEAERVPGIMPSEVADRNDPKYKTILGRTPGALGCYLSQRKCMEKALAENKHAGVLEDDLVFASDIQERLDYYFKFLDTHSWDVAWLGSTFHREPVWHAAGHPNQIQGKCFCSLNRDWEPTDDRKIVRTFGEWCTYAYVVNVKSIPQILKMLDTVQPKSIGIDFSFIMLEPFIFSYAMLPGSVKQIDNKSDIGTGITKFSGFSVLGEYWYQDRMDNFNYENFYR